MGSHHSHNGSSRLSGDEKSQGGSGTNTPRAGSKKGMSRSSSGADIQVPEKVSHMVPVEKLGKLLAQKSQKDDGVNGITEKSFTKYLFPHYPELGRSFYNYMHRLSKSKNHYIPVSAFKVQCEKILSVLDDEAIIEIYVRMFGDEDDENSVSPAGLKRLLMTCYRLSMDHYPEGAQTCLMIHSTLQAVVDACFSKNDAHSVGFVVRWLGEHCHRLIFPLHRYSVHVISTQYRFIEQEMEGDDAGAGLELATPVLDKQLHATGSLLPVSVAWLLAGTLPPRYTQPHHPPQPPGGGLASVQFLQRLVSIVPSHWVLLYDSREHGLGANRFLHHVTAYRGPTLVMFKCAGGAGLFVVATPQEWRETHLYWGDKDAALIQVFPKFSIIEHAPKMLYLNTSIRGYPKGLRAGADPRKPLLIVEEDFDKIQFKGIPYSLEAIEVWGCGDQASRESQLDVKKWQVREAERQRQVKLSAADWIDHPDRYLLELAGRPQYNNSAS